MTPSQRNIVGTYHTSNHRLAVKIGWWSTIPVFRDTRVCHFCSYHAIENESHFKLDLSSFKPIRDKFPSLFEDVVLESLKSVFQFDHQVDINFFLKEVATLCHSRELVDLKPSWCPVNPISLLAL